MNNWDSEANMFSKHSESYRNPARHWRQSPNVILTYILVSPMTGLCFDSALRGPAQPYVSRSGVSDFLVEADVQVVAWLVGDEQADGKSPAGGGLSDVDLDLSL